MELLLCALVVIYVLHRRSELQKGDWWIPAAGLAIVLALFFVTHPETRVLLMFADYMGVDLIATMAVVYLRHHLGISVALVAIPLLRLAYRWGPVPGFWPHRVVFRSSLVWTGYAVICPLLVAAMAAMWLFFLGCLATLANPWIA
jgi:hypothetical protein